MLLTPDAYTNDWYGWVTNQSAHILLGMVIALITRRVWPAVVMAVLIEFLHPTLTTIADGLGLTPERVDELWREAMVA